MYQGRQVSPSANREKRSNLRGFVAGIAMNMATIRAIVPKRRRCMEHKCQKSKKMRMRKGLQVLDPHKMGLQVLDPAQGCNGQVRPRVVLHGNDDHECSNSGVFQPKNRKSLLAVCAIRLNGQTDRFIQTVRITIRPELLPYHSSLLIICIKAATLVFDL
jgi:hypothetical protein